MPDGKKKVVYLLGSGATHAVVNDLNSQVGLLTANVKDRFEAVGAQWKNEIDPSIWDEAVKETVDIEHLISVIESDYRFHEANYIREIYRKAITELVSQISDLSQPNLYSVLLDLHNVADLNEDILCFLTLNYEDILEKTIEIQFGKKVDYGIQLEQTVAAGDSVQVLKLHGSFSWLNNRPVEVKELSAIDLGKALWIPPGVEKRKDNYPFNLLWGKALEALLSCDVLRIIGCSLSRNDWGLIPLIYTAQAFDGTGHKFVVEVIDRPRVVERMKYNYGYLSFRGPEELSEFVSYYAEQLEVADKNAVRSELKSILDGDNVNLMKMWLEVKVEQLAKPGISSIETGKHYVSRFYNKE